MSNNLPPNLPRLKAGWSWVKLGDVCKVKGGFAFKSKNYAKEGIPLVRISNIEDKKISLEDCVYIQPEDEKKIKEFLLNKGDILIALSGATTGKYGIYNLDKKAFLNQRIGRLHFNGSDKIIPSYVYLYLEIIRSEILKTAYGAAQPNISPTEIAEFPIPLPPLPEQKKIVEKIEELFSGLDSGVALLKKAKEQIKLYRQSVLASAFNGKLIGNGNINEKTGLPEGWKWVELSEVLEVKDGTHDTPKYQDKGVPFITQKNIKNGEFVFDNYNLISEDDHQKFYKRSNVAYNDIIISMIGANRGMSTIVKTKKTFSIKNVGLVKTDESKFLANYLDYYFKSENGQSTILLTSKGGAQQFIGLTELRNWLVPQTSLDQQTQIVSEIEKRISEADNLEKAIDESLEKADKLRQSILKKAFEGKLV